MYRDEQDLVAMRALVAANYAAGSVKDHVGDLTWGLYQNTVFDPHTSIRLCEDDGKLLGYVWVHRPSDVQWTLDPGLPEGDAVEQDLVAWGEAECEAALGTDAQQSHDLALLYRMTSMSVLPSSPAGAMRARMISCTTLNRVLEVSLPEPMLPPGWTIRPVGNEDEWQARVDIHREVWHPSKVTLEAYRRLRRAPGYDPDFDLVAVDPTGEFGAYCICWIDEQNRCAEFEPVGTRSAFRGLGIGKAIVREGLRRLQQRGMRRAWSIPPTPTCPRPSCISPPVSRS